MFEEPCPHCNKKLSLNQRRGLLVRAAIFCVYCANPIRINLKNQYLNSVALGVLVGGLLALVTNLSTEIVIICGVLSSIFLQRFLDIFFSLEKAKESDLL